MRTERELMSGEEEEEEEEGEDSVKSVCILISLGGAWKESSLWFLPFFSCRMGQVPFNED